MATVYIGGVAMTAFARRPDVTLKQLAAEAVVAALADAGVTATDVQAAFVGNAGAARLGQTSIVGQVVLRPVGIGGIAVVNVDNACAGGSTATHLAWQTVAAGAADVVLALGVEKMSVGDRHSDLAAMLGGLDYDERERLLASVADPSGAAPGAGRPRSPFMDVYASLIREHMRRHGTTREQMAKVAAKSHWFGARNPYAQFRRELRPSEILAAPVVADPLTVPMCAPVGDGAAALVLLSSAAAKRLPDQRPRPQVRASVLRSAAAPEAGEPPAAQRAAAAAYDSAAIGPSEIDVAEVHDATAPAEILAYEELGFCEPGEGGRLVDEGVTSAAGRLPVNPSGGLVSRGHPVAATGIAQLVELTWQLQGRAGERQVDHPRVALAHNGGGWLGNDAAALSVHIMSV